MSGHEEDSLSLETRRLGHQAQSTCLLLATIMWSCHQTYPFLCALVPEHRIEGEALGSLLLVQLRVADDDLAPPLISLSNTVPTGQKSAVQVSHSCHAQWMHRAAEPFVQQNTNLYSRNAAVLNLFLAQGPDTHDDLDTFFRLRG